MTSSTEFRFIGRDGLSIACTRWQGSDSVRAMVQIARGIGEHIGRYVETIDALVSAGLAVYGNDHRGHCRTACDKKHLGDFGRASSGLRKSRATRAKRFKQRDARRLEDARSKESQP